MTIFPELVLAAGALTLFLVSLAKTPSERLSYAVALVFGTATFVATLLSFHSQGLLFYGAYAVDQYSQLFKVLIAFSLLISLGFVKNLKGVSIDIHAEYYLFLLLCVLGLMMLVSSVELIAILVSLELSSFALYLLVPMRDDRTGLRMQMEAGMKYILFGIMATGFMLYGMSLLFGLTGTTYLKDILVFLGNSPPQPVVVIAILMVQAGFLYKLAAFPMHFWVPDVYQGACNATAGVIATLPKFAAVALLIRFFILPTGHAPMVVELLAVLALCSMFYGNLCALVQKDLKRMLGFSGIAHAGFILLALLTLKAEGYGVAIYYIAGYVLMNLACFLVINQASQGGENVRIDDLSGLYKRQPMLAFVLATGLFGLAGIPPFIGFMGKFLVLTTVLRADHLLVVCLAVINTAIAIYYYLSVVKVVYTVEPEDRPAIAVGPMVQLSGIVLVIMITLLGVFPGKLVDYASTVVQSLH
ncbi:NADH-quinone oxidoreductase subunit N [Desulfobulbus oligotrophicus]|uniref:NADH-quinone oxidoreductase subunit N n=1 Tax=Desulfobulbus oligotrophicus TaxID=1909699 RepID=A0A7T5VDA0_9BACT|nr:NADH-quinone oxidoreductase subunit N [Desulfobulbus oligotrophicus]QQG65800.1 NADH-quinone oxidoreductase subunit N [Desulfobulbus oligotrophicus]